MTTKTRPPGPLPTGSSVTRFVVDGQTVEITVYWTEIGWLARRAIGNKSRRSVSGPITAKVVRS